MNFDPTQSNLPNLIIDPELNNTAGAAPTTRSPKEDKVVAIYERNIPQSPITAREINQQSYFDERCVKVLAVIGGLTLVGTGIGILTGSDSHALGWVFIAVGITALISITSHSLAQCHHTGL